MNQYCYLAEVDWIFDNATIRHNNIIYADSYSGAMQTIINYYGDEDIVSVKLTYLSETLFRIPSESIETLTNFQDEA